MSYLVSASSIEPIERAIAEQANKVCSFVALRKERPSYGYTKGMIRHEGSVLDGMIGLYQIMTGQATHPSVPNLAEFVSAETTERVKTARRLVSEL